MVVVVGPKQPLPGRLGDDILLAAAADDDDEAVRILVADLAELLLLLLLLFRNVRLAVTVPARGQRNSSTGFDAHRGGGGVSWVKSLAVTAAEWAQEAMDGGGMVDICFLVV